MRMKLWSMISLRFLRLMEKQVKKLFSFHYKDTTQRYLDRLADSTGFVVTLQLFDYSHCYCHYSRSVLALSLFVCPLCSSLLSSSFIYRILHFRMSANCYILSYGRIALFCESSTLTVFSRDCLLFWTRHARSIHARASASSITSLLYRCRRR